MAYFVYILASKRNGTLYIGVTNDLARRTFEHKTGAVPGFTRKYRVQMLVHYESYDEIGLALQRERNLKHWNRQWKLALIEQLNPQWRDLHEDLQK
ncbi:MAG: GIY-YIG nuclease family protein [Pseudomonadota bacterium]|nr:GIY-YIG nuclease family protein [Pseudomonadota bacterium]